MKNKRYLFICSTRYTTFNSINLVLNNPDKYNGKSDLALFHQTDETKKLSENLKKSGIFSAIYDFPFINNLNTIYLIIVFIFPRFILHRLSLNKDSISLIKNHYHTIYSQNLLYATLFKLINKKSNTYLIEEGLSSYTSRTLDVTRRSFFYRLLKKTNLDHFFLADIKGQLLYKPELFCGEKGNMNYLSINEPKHRTTFNSIFQYKANDLYTSNQFVYLGTPYYGLRKLISDPSIVDKSLEERCKSIVDDSMQILKRSSFVYRVHPIEKIDNNFYEKFCKLDKYQNMWEIECQNSITSDHILMSFFSTASFTPKLLYGKEPYLIFLDRLTGYDFLNSGNLILGLKSLYKKPEKIMQPKSIDELFKIIENLS